MVFCYRANVGDITIYDHYHWSYANFQKKSHHLDLSKQTAWMIKFQLQVQVQVLVRSADDLKILNEQVTPSMDVSFSGVTDTFKMTMKDSSHSNSETVVQGA